MSNYKTGNHLLSNAPLRTKISSIDVKTLSIRCVKKRNNDRK